MKNKLVFLTLCLPAACFAGPVNFGPMLSHIDWSTGILALLAIMGGLAGVFVVIVGGGLILDRLTPKGVAIGGRRWDEDVVHAAMQDLENQRRRGVLLDRESSRALRDYKRGR